MNTKHIHKMPTALTHEEIANRLKEKHLTLLTDAETLSGIRRRDGHIRVMCNNCEYEFPITICNIHHKTPGGCKNCGCKSLFESRCALLTSLIINGNVSNEPHKFVNVRPKCMGGLELDIYCADLKLAIEANGIQHYQYVPRFHASPDDLKSQQERDALKAQRCAEQNIDLISVKYTIDSKIDTLATYLYDEITKLGHESKFTREYLCTDAFHTELFEALGNCTNAQKEYETIKENCEKRGYKLITEHYVANKGNIVVECDKGHHWNTTPSQLTSTNNGNIRMCGMCNHNYRFNDDEVYDMLDRMGYTWTDGDYTNVDATSLVIHCKTCQYEFTTSITNLKKRGCTKCNDRREYRTYTLNDFKQRVNEINHHITCITEGDPNSPANTGAEHRFQCSYGHTFIARGNSYSSNTGSGCHVCSADKRKVPADGHHILAALMGGRCLNKAPLLNTQHQRMIWKCNDDSHQVVITTFNGRGTTSGGIKLKLFGVNKTPGNICTRCHSGRPTNLSNADIITALREDQSNVPRGSNHPEILDDQLMNHYGIGTDTVEMPIIDPVPAQNAIAPAASLKCDKPEVFIKLASLFPGITCISKAPYRTTKQYGVFVCDDQTHIPIATTLEIKGVYKNGELSKKKTKTGADVGMCMMCTRGGTMPTWPGVIKALRNDLIDAKLPAIDDDIKLIEFYGLTVRYGNRY